MVASTRTLVLLCALSAIEVCFADISPTEHNNKFATSFYTHICDKPGNILFSPFSIQAVLALVRAGAKGSTGKQIEVGAYLPDSLKIAAKRYGKIKSNFEKETNVTLRFANGIYVDDKFTLKPEYLTTVRDRFKSEVNHVSFGNNVEATKTINSWVANKTNNKIHEMFSPGSLDSNTKLLLLNAIYFKGAWEVPFKTRLNEEGDFHLNDKETRKVDFMNRKGQMKHSYNSEIDADFVELKYLGGSVSMVLVVPKQINGLSKIEEAFKTKTFEQLHGRSFNRELELKMPKFKLDQTIELNEILMKMGITDMFSATSADLSAISSEKLYVSKAVQKSLIEVNEAGAEAVAATGINVVPFSLIDTRVTVSADKPFLFLLLSKREKTILFMGRFSDVK